MKDLGKIIFYLVATVVLGALLAPPLYWGLQWLNSHGVLLNLADTGLPRVFNRGILVAALVLFWPMARWIKVPGIRELGLQKNPRRWQDLGVGFLASFLVMALFALALFYLEVYHLRKPPRWDALRQVITSAVTVSILEEWVFRGALLGLCLRAMKPWPALFSVSALYSIVHFVKPKADLPADFTVHWFSGLGLIPKAFAPFTQPWLLLGGFLTLFCVGWILGWARLRTGALAMGIGLHAGWIIGKMGLGPIARRKIKDTLPWLGEDITVGICSVFMVLLTGLLVWLWITRFRKAPGKPHHPHESAIAGPESR